MQIELEAKTAKLPWPLLVTCILRLHFLATQIDVFARVSEGEKRSLPALVDTKICPLRTYKYV